jgi:very-short-patch-repair endonuclease
MASSKGNRGTLVDNLDLVIDLYRYQWFDTVQISKLYGVSSSAVSEILKRNGVLSETRHRELFSAIMAANQQIQCDDIERIRDLLKPAYPTITTKRIRYTLEKEGRAKLKKRFDFLDHSLIQEKLMQGETAAAISKECRCRPADIYKISKQLGIEIQKTDRFKQIIKSKQNLEELLQSHTSAGIGKKFGFSSDVVRFVAKDFGINLGIPSEVKARLLDKKWCEAAYQKTKSYKTIARDLLDNQVGPDTVAYYCQNMHNIPKMQLIDHFPELADKKFVEDQYNGKSLIQAATDLGCSPWLFKESLIEHGISITNFHQTSLPEKQIASMLDGAGINYCLNDRQLIKPKEIDILCPDQKVGIEFCGIYYHSSKFKDKDYHREKYLLMKDLGYRLITVYESEWMEKQNIVAKKILNILGVDDSESIGARNTVVRSVSEAATRAFLEENHIQGFTKASIRLGLYDKNNTLVALMAFVKKATHHELVRFATSKKVVGGFSKLLSYFERHYQWQQIVSFADLRWTAESSNIYQAHGFELNKQLGPAFSWVSRKGLHRREVFMKSKQSNIFENFDPNLTEEENCFHNNVYKIYDCGKLKYIKYNQHMAQPKGFTQFT